MAHPKRYTVTSALPYANGPLHIGHIAGAYLPADIYVRYLRLKGEDVKFICGSDEHGVAITLKARKEDKTPQEIVDEYHELNKKTFERFGIDFDIYHRTSDKLHHETASEFFKSLYEKGEFIKEEKEQYYDEEEEQFLADRYIEGTCPNCGYEHAYGDQCEKCGKSLSPEDLIDPKSMLSGNAPVKKKTTHWYLDLGKHQTEWLEDWIDSKKGVWKSNVYGQCKSWLDQKLQPRAVTRDLKWGVPVPLKEAEGKVLYVWFDAPIGYISATKALTDQWEKYWKKQSDEADNAELIHFIGKDNIVFHCIIFPAILKAEGSYILPTHVPANEFLNLEGNKLSTSKNWAVWLHEYLDDFPGKEDVLRYTLCTVMPEARDSEFTWEDFQSKNNNELVATLGNFVNRVLVLTHKYFDGVVPSGTGALEQNIQQCYQLTEQHLDKFEFRLALNQIIELARVGNRYLTEKEPWKLIKTDEQATADVLADCLQVITHLSVLIEPFLPFTTKKLKNMLNLKELIRWGTPSTTLPEGHTLNKPELLFEKIEADTIQQQIDKLYQKVRTEDVTYEPVKPEMQFEDFMKQDLRVGKIVAAEKVKKADKLLKLTVDLGFEQRTIVSGIAEFYKPEEVIGRQVSVVVNLAPKKLRGVLSQGMILMAEDADGKLSFVSPVEEMPTGSVIR